jgi:hypothetical protein
MGRRKEKKTMIEDAINKILELAPSKPIEVDNGRKYWSKTGNAISEPSFPTILVYSLTGLVDYLANGFDNKHQDKLDRLGIVITNEQFVDVVGAVRGPWNDRDVLIRAQFREDAFPWGQWKGVEEFLIMLKARFVDTPHREKVLKHIGNVQSINSARYSDDGVTQTVGIKSGVASVDEVEIPPVVKLAPRRTFPEVDQPTSEFVFRVKEGSGGINCALFEADGGAWRNEARANIKAFFESQLGEDCPVILA